MSIWNEPLTKEEYRRRLFAAKAEQRRADANLPFEDKVEIVLALQDASRELRSALTLRPAAGQPRTEDFTGCCGAPEDTEGR